MAQIVFVPGKLTQERYEEVLLALADVVLLSPVPWAVILRELHGIPTQILKVMFYEDVLPACVSNFCGPLPVVKGRLNRDTFFQRIKKNKEKRISSPLFNRWFVFCFWWRKIWLGWIWKDLARRLAITSLASTPEELETILTSSTVCAR